MSLQTFELSSSSDPLDDMGSDQRRGCSVSIVAGFFLLLLALVAIVGTAVVVYLATARVNDLQVRCTSSNMTVH